LETTSVPEKNVRLLPPRQAARILGISYSTLKRWILAGQIKSVKTRGGHHRIPEGELDRYLYRAPHKSPITEKRRQFRRISGRNQLIGRITSLKIEGLLAQVTLSIGGQRITSIITADAARELRLQEGQTAAALIKATEVMILRV
jgi:molybdopterin-binding protein